MLRMSVIAEGERAGISVAWGEGREREGLLIEGRPLPLHVSDIAWSNSRSKLHIISPCIFYFYMWSAYYSACFGDSG